MTRKLRILYSIPNFDTAGSGKVVVDLVKGLDKKRFSPEILVKHKNGVFFKEVEKLGIPIHVFPYETSYYPFWSFFFRLLKVVRYFKKHNWDIIHSWHWSSDFSEALAAKFAGIKFVYTKKAMGWGNKAWKWKSLLSTKVIAINTAMMTEFFNPLPKVNAVFLPLGLNVEEYKPKEKNKTIRDRYAISSSEFVVISVVNMVPVKGIEILIEAVIRTQQESIKLLLVGDDRSDYVDQLKSKYKSRPNIIFIGKQSNVQDYLSVADLFVIPTKNEGKKEGMPMAPVEAMAMGIPVLGSRIAGITDILKNFEDHLFQAGDIEELSKLICLFARMDEPIRKEIGLNMRKMVVENYSLREFIRSREKLYESL
ncbi:glycosyltransferase [Winogradskyella psychrotolerans]|uniref:glycosyltransferase n=1 Tax=Winogradskyella psychrotolerans TaxID=1344585 RepID=UPI001C07A392|nr:glycosyltransferase [Winogradskyella psychrotolerans]MBU2929549.1 glycosyltransferase [Winogradskyella psychrotolerans]